MLKIALALTVTAFVLQDHPPVFEPIQPEAMGAGANLTNAFADFDNDGDPDLFVGFDGTPNRLYRNDKGAFTDVAAAAGIADARATRAAAWGDFDGDGDPDLLVGFTPLKDASVLRLYRNTVGKFTDATADAGLAVATGAVRQPVWIDFDNDGDLDLFVAFRDRGNALYRNDRGKFTDIAAMVGLADTRKTVGAVWFDYDMDGDLDVAVANMDGDPNGLFRNDHGKFTDVAAAAGVEWGGRAPKDPANGTVRLCAADVDGDGLLDLFAANYGPLGFFKNIGHGRFRDASAEWHINIDSRYDSCAFADYDNDGTLDLYVNGTVTGGTSYKDSLYQNTSAALIDVTPPVIRSLEADHGVQWADVDGDGDLDLALTGSRPDGTHVVLRNMLPAADAARSVRVRVVNYSGRATKAGAEVRAFATDSRRRLGTALVDSGSGYDAQSDLPVHIGVPAGVPFVELQITVPGGGRRTLLHRHRVPVGTTVTVRTK